MGNLLWLGRLTVQCLAQCTGAPHDGSMQLVSRLDKNSGEHRGPTGVIYVGSESRARTLHAVPRKLIYFLAYVCIGHKKGETL